MYKTASFIIMIDIIKGSSANKYCSLESNGEAKYLICSRNEYCCHFGCCVHLAFQFYQLWYYWLLLIFMFMICSGGSWWYKFCRQSETTNYPSIPPSIERNARNHQVAHIEARRARFNERNHHNNTSSIHLQRLWKMNGLAPPPNYYAAASVVRYYSASELEARRQQQECPYYQLYGPPPRYESVVQIYENGNGTPSCTLISPSMNSSIPSIATSTTRLISNSTLSTIDTEKTSVSNNNNTTTTRTAVAIATTSTTAITNVTSNPTVVAVHGYSNVLKNLNSKSTAVKYPRNENTDDHGDEDNDDEDDDDDDNNDDNDEEDDDDEDDCSPEDSDENGYNDFSVKDHNIPPANKVNILRMLFSKERAPETANAIHQPLQLSPSTVSGNENSGCSNSPAVTTGFTRNMTNSNPSSSNQNDHSSIEIERDPSSSASASVSTSASTLTSKPFTLLGQFYSNGGNIYDWNRISLPPSSSSPSSVRPIVSNSTFLTNNYPINCITGNTNAVITTENNFISNPLETRILLNEPKSPSSRS